jgi:hypothetical protein
MHSPLRRAAKALAGLVVAAGFAPAAAPPGGAASIGEGATEKQISVSVGQRATARFHSQADVVRTRAPRSASSLGAATVYARVMAAQ